MPNQPKVPNGEDADFPRYHEAPIEIMTKKVSTLLLAALVVLWAFSPGNVAAQTIRFARQPAPYYVGQPVVVQVLVRGVDGDTKVACKLHGKAPDALAMQGPQMGRSVQSMTQIINGRTTNSESVDYQFSFVLTASREGEFSVGPFDVTVGGKVQSVEGATFRFGKLQADPDMQIALVIPETKVYVGQKVPISITWSFVGDMNTVQYAFSNLEIRSPLFDQFQFEDKPARTRTALTLATAKGEVAIDAKVVRKKIDGHEAFVLTATRTLVPDTVGQFTSIPITCRTQRVTEWRRDLFGDLSPRRSRPIVAAGKPIDILVKPIPSRDRPDSFAGAVGTGFSIDVSANRSVVRVGDPIALTVTVRGDGNLEGISLPPLTASVGWSPDLFQVPSEQVAGHVNANTKQFKLSVRVKSTSVTQIPPVAFSWFDPKQETFQTKESRPIALQVMKTRVISANDVVSSSNQKDGGSEPTGSDREPVSDNRTSGSKSLQLSGVNLAIETDMERLLPNLRTRPRPVTMAILIYVLGLSMIIGSLLIRRHIGRDTEVIRKKNAIRQTEKQLIAARTLARREAADQIAKSLRRIIAELETPRRSELNELVGICDNMIYAPDDVTDVEISEVVDRALGIVREMATT